MTPVNESTVRHTLAVAERAAELLRIEGVRVAVIGAVAMAAHGYPRATRDIDLATATDPFTTLAKVAAACRNEGWTDRLILPDGQDPLGGVLTITGPGFRPVQIVNFYNPLLPVANPGPEAIDSAVAAIQGSSLPVVDLAHLIALKLYAGGRKSDADVLELLARNPDADVERIASVCARFELADDFARVRERPSL